MALISTLTDNFNDNSIDTINKWNATATYVVEINKQIEITVPASTTEQYSEIVSKVPYDLTGSGVSIKLIDAGNLSLASYRFYFALDSGPVTEVNRLMWYVSGSNIKAYDAVNGFVYTATYVSATYRYLRIREASGTIYWDYSADGIYWTNAISKANPFSVTSKYVEFYGYTSNPEALDSIAKIDDFNILPSGTTKHFRTLMGVGV